VKLLHFTFFPLGKLLQAVQKFGSNLEDYLHLLLPPIVKLFDAIDVNINVRRTALETVDLISDTLDLSDFASRIIQPLVRCIENTSELRPVAMETLASLVAQLGKKFLIFIPMVQKVLNRNRIQHQRYDVLVAKILHVSKSLLLMIRQSDFLFSHFSFDTRVVVQPTKKIYPRLVSGGEILKPKKD
jgi:phosphatidylinositol kinase/protein kinase (PI-3  family)